MVKKVLILGVIALMACRQSDRKAETVEVAEQEAEEAVMVDETRIPVYDFNEFESLLHQETDKTYVVNFWATWCAPCIKELPYFERINQEEKRNGVEVILVSLDMPTMWESHLVPFVKKKALASRIVILDDPKQNDWIPKIAEDWTGAIPATLIYNSKKRTFYEQPFTYDELREQLNTFIQ